LLLQVLAQSSSLILQATKGNGMRVKGSRQREVNNNNMEENNTATT
jgi:hypothetical protein